MNFQNFVPQSEERKSPQSSSHHNYPHHQGHSNIPKNHSKKGKKNAKTHLNNFIPSNNLNEDNTFTNNFSNPSYVFNSTQVNQINNPFQSNSSSNSTKNTNYPNQPNFNFPTNPLYSNNQQAPHFFINQTNANYNQPHQNFPHNPYQEFNNPQNSNFQSNEHFNYNQPQNYDYFNHNFQPLNQNLNPFSNANPNNPFNPNANLNEEEKHRIPNQSNVMHTQNRNNTGQNAQNPHSHQGNSHEIRANHRSNHPHRGHHRGRGEVNRFFQNSLFDFNAFSPFIDFQNIFSSFFGDNLGGEIVFEYPMENFGINYLSNFHDNPDILDFIQNLSFNDNRNHSRPVKKSVLKKIRTFPLAENNCKKNDKGILEMPTCSVCFNQMKLKENVMLIPCGHMYHPNCLKPWFENNNTCPVCRYELPTE